MLWILFLEPRYEEHRIENLKDKVLVYCEIIKNIANTMLVSFDMKFIRRDQKTRRNGEIRQAIPMRFLVEPDYLDIERH